MLDYDSPPFFGSPYTSLISVAVSGTWSSIPESYNICTSWWCSSYFTGTWSLVCSAPLGLTFWPWHLHCTASEGSLKAGFTCPYFQQFQFQDERFSWWSGRTELVCQSTVMIAYVSGLFWYKELRSVKKPCRHHLRLQCLRYSSNISVAAGILLLYAGAILLLASTLSYFIPLCYL